ncbi:hypothetical protein [uncultured Friedmanniella sp.]|uniref:hypothetical protein n=1 Tax=uncultured Friedmanniella sp. TaxID=335381 RepID=UPI0035CBFB12
MTYGVIVRVAGDVADYDQLHEATVERTGGDLGGLLLHIGRATEEGFEIIEVWDTPEQFDRCNREVIWPLMAEIGAPRPAAEPVVVEFTPRGLVLAGTRIVR